MYAKSLLLLFSLCPVLLFSQQNLMDSIVPSNVELASALYYNGETPSLPNYQKIQEQLGVLEAFTGGYEPEERYRLMRCAFTMQDYETFKRELAVMVEKYGFQVAYISEEAPYCQMLLKGDLSVWFKEMYLKNHKIWLQNNFDKQIDLKKLNEISARDVWSNNYRLTIEYRAPNLDSIQRKEVYNLSAKTDYENYMTLYRVSKKWDGYPSTKKFALVQNSFTITELHNMQIKAHIQDYWKALFPYYVKAYKNNEITRKIFYEYDCFSWIHFGYQYFGLLNLDELPERKGKKYTMAPVKDLKYANQIRTELGWSPIDLPEYKQP